MEADVFRALLFSPLYPVWTWLLWPSLRSVTSSWEWRSRLRHSSVSRSLRLRSRRKNSRNSQPRRPEPSTSTATRSSLPRPQTTRPRPSLLRPNGESGLAELFGISDTVKSFFKMFPFQLIMCLAHSAEPYLLLISTCEPTTSTCRLMTSRRRATRTSCPRMSSRSSSASQICELRYVWGEVVDVLLI